MAEFLSHPIPAVILLLGILVLVHELGHFLVGVAFGVGVETFSVGFGAKMFGFRHNGTDYRISWLPLGGYVKFAGAVSTEEVPERFAGREMFRAAIWKRFLIVLAGPAANILLAVVVYGVLGFAGIKHASPVVGQIRDTGPAGAVGIMSGDIVKEINGQTIQKWDELQNIISESPNQKLSVKIQRNEENLDFIVIPESVEAQDIFGKKLQVGRIGIGYGFVPPVVSIISKESVAYTAGLRTGDMINAIKIGDRNYNVSNWPDLQKAFLRVYESRDLESRPEIVVQIERDNLQLKFPQVLWNQFSKDSDHDIRILYNEIEKNLGITDSQLTIESLDPALELSLKKYDRLVEFDAVAIKDIYHLQELLMNNKKKQADIKIQRNGEELALNINLKPVDVQRPEGVETIFTLPVAFSGASVAPEPFLEQYTSLTGAFVFGLHQTLNMSQKIFGGIAGLFTGQVPLKSLGGPMMIAKVAGDSAKMGWQAFLTSLALISINLGLINLVPIPALDGGHIVMMIIEAIKRGPLGEEAMENYHKIGFVMVIALMILATYNDISRFWKSMLEGLTGVF